jgi:hypothetical protein
MSLANQLDADARTLDNLRRRTPDALRIMAALMANGYSTGRGGATGKHEVSDRTANAALANTTGTGAGYHVSDHWDALQDHARALATVLADMLAIVAVYERTLHPDVPRCSADPTWPGYHETDAWHDPSCEAVPAKGPQCVACYHRRRRWSILNNCWREEVA